VSDKELLRFRWGKSEYGVAIEDVVGMIGAPQLNDPANKKGNSLAILGLQTGCEIGGNQQAIILNTDGIGLVLIVDEVIKIGSLSRDPAQGGKQASLTIWKFDDAHACIETIIDIKP